MLPQCLFGRAPGCPVLKPMLVHLTNARAVPSRHEDHRATSLERWARHALFEPRLLKLIDRYLHVPVRCATVPFPVSVACDLANQRLWCLAECDSMLHELDWHGRCLSREDDYDGLTHVHMDHARSVLYVCAPNNDQMLFGLDMRHRRPLDNFVPLGDLHPTKVAVHPRTGTLFVCDVSQHQVWVLPSMMATATTGLTSASKPPEPKPWFTVGSFGSGPGQFDGPYSAAVNVDDNELYVAEICNHRVSVFSCDGTFLRWIGDRGPYPLQRPQLVVFHPQTSEIVVFDYGYHALLVFDRHGQYRRRVGSKGSGHNQFQHIYDMCVHPLTGHMLVADPYNNRLQSFAWCE